MDKLNLFDVDKEYIKTLQQAESEIRGFTRVPNMDYPGQEQKFLCGIVLIIKDTDYYVPCSSYKIKKQENLLIVFDDDKINPTKGSLRFNYMIPVPKDKIYIRVIKDEQNPSRRIFLQKQLDFMNKNRETIYHLAEKTYRKVINHYNPFLNQNSCDFQLLEKICHAYDQPKHEEPNMGEIERTPFNHLLIELRNSKELSKISISKDYEPER